MILNYPEDSLQFCIEPDLWWVEIDKPDFRRGMLVKAFVPHVDQNPFTLVPVGRSQPTEHNIAHVKIIPLNIREIIRFPLLPVAALPQFKGEMRAVYRAKKRPALIVSSGGPKVPDRLTQNKAKWQTVPTIIIAPFYGADETSKRSGFNPAFVERVRRCEYPQFFWDSLPIDSNTHESILRFDHIQPVGRNQDAVELTKYCLSDTALSFIDEWLSWIITGSLDADSLLGDYRERLLQIPFKCQS